MKPGRNFKIIWLIHAAHLLLLALGLLFSAIPVADAATVGPPPPIPTPLPPTGLTATLDPTNVHKITVGWTWLGNTTTLQKFELNYTQVSPLGVKTTVNPGNTDTTYIITDAKGGANYSLSLVAIGINNQRSSPDKTSTSTYPAQPGALSFSGQQADSFVITWLQKDNAESYDITVTDEANAIATGSDTTRTISGLSTAGKEYTVNVEARNGQKKSVTRSGKGRTRPRKPQAVTEKSATETSIKLTVNRGDQTTLDTYRVVARCNGTVKKNETFSPTNINDASVDLDITDLEAGRNYTFEVLSISSGLDSGEWAKSGDIGTYPAQPGEIKFSDQRPGSFVITWNQRGYASYDINVTGEPGITVDGSGTNRTISGLSTAGKLYTVNVQAVNGKKKKVPTATLR